MRLALLFGGSRGLGEALYRHLRRVGYQVIEFSRSAPHETSVAIDLADPAAARATVQDSLVDLISQSWQEVLVIYNAALLGPVGPVGEQEPDAILAHLNTNFSSAILIMGMACKLFENNVCKKTLLSVSSGAAQRSVEGWSLYCSSKAGLERFVATLALEQSRLPAPFAAYNIDPGVMDTGMQAQIRASHAHDFPEVGRFIARYQAGELRQPDEVAQAIVRIAEASDLQSGHRYAVADFLDD